MVGNHRQVWHPTAVKLLSRLKAAWEANESTDDLYRAVKGTAGKIKALIQMAIGIGVIGAFIIGSSSKHVSIADRALTLIGTGLAISAAVELAYTFFTPSLDEALDPLILGISAFVLIGISKKDPAFDQTHVSLVLLASLAITSLFIARRFLLPNEDSGSMTKQRGRTPDEANDTDLSAGREGREGS